MAPPPATCTNEGGTDDNKAVSRYLCTGCCCNTALNRRNRSPLVTLNITHGWFINGCAGFRLQCESPQQQHNNDSNDNSNDNNHTHFCAQNEHTIAVAALVVDGEPIRPLPYPPPGSLARRSAEAHTQPKMHKPLPTGIVHPTPKCIQKHMIVRQPTHSPRLCSHTML
jgi:hypothetical protein